MVRVHCFHKLGHQKRGLWKPPSPSELLRVPPRVLERRPPTGDDESGSFTDSGTDGHRDKVGPKGSPACLKNVLEN